MSSIPDGIATVSEKLTLRFMNSAMEELTGISSATAINKPITVIFPKKSKIITLIKKTIYDRGTHSIHDYPYFRLLDKNTFPASVSVSPILDEKAGATGAVLVMRNFKILREFEERMLRTEKLTLAGTLAAGMAHEIKNPLGGIRGAAQLIMEEMPASDYRDHIDLIKKEADRINSIVETLLGITKTRPANMGRVNIHQVLDDIIKLLSKETGEQRITVNKNYDPSLPCVRADSSQLTQVLLNLLKNGVESISSKGKLTLTTRISHDYSLVHGGNEKVQMGVVEIYDTGQGLTNDALEYAFTPFYTTKSNGNGLGLAISYKIIEQHNGKITLSNRKDKIKGAIAQVFIPLFREE